MTITVTPTFIQTPGNGAATVFNFPFLITASSDLAVGFIVSAGYTLQTSGFAVSFAPGVQGGQVTFSTPPPLGTTVDLRSEIPETQPTNFSNLGGYFPENTTNAMDRNTRLIQDLYRLCYQFGVHGPDQETTPWPALPAAAQRANLGLVFDTNGLPAVGALSATVITGPIIAALLNSGLLGPILNPRTTGPNSETTNGVVPTTSLLPYQGYIAEPLDVRRYGAIGAGGNTGADNAAFLLAQQAAGSAPVFVPSANYIWDLSTYIDGNFESDGKLRYSNVGYVKYKTVQDNSVTDWNQGLAGLQWNGPQILILGDSITEGTVGNPITAGFSYITARSLMNQADHGFDQDPGFGYHSTVNFNDLLTLGEASWTGSISTTGLTNARLSLAPGQFLQLSGKSVTSIDVAYDGAVSSGSLVFAINGSNYATKPVSGSSINSTYQTVIRTSNGVAAQTNENDIITITAQSGTVVLTAILPIRTSSGSGGAASPYVFIAPQSGTTYGDFTSVSRVNEMAFYLNMFRPGNEKLIILALGTNSIYSPGNKATTPAAMIAAASSLIGQLQAQCSTLRIAMHVPPRSNESLFPVILSGYTHQDYANAIEDFCRTNNYTIIRQDRSFLSYGNNYVDGLHPNSLGHRQMAKNILDMFWCPINPYLKNTLTDGQYNNWTDLTYNSTWGSFAGATANRLAATRTGNICMLSGTASPNGSSSTTVATIPAGWAPSGTVRRPTCDTDAGPVSITISTAGIITVTSVPASFLCLDGICFPINRP